MRSIYAMSTPLAAEQTIDNKTRGRSTIFTNTVYVIYIYIHTIIIVIRNWVTRWLRSTRASFYITRLSRCRKKKHESSTFFSLYTYERKEKERRRQSSRFRALRKEEKKLVQPIYCTNPRLFFHATRVGGEQENYLNFSEVFNIHETIDKTGRNRWPATTCTLFLKVKAHPSPRL